MAPVCKNNGRSAKETKGGREKKESASQRTLQFNTRPAGGTASVMKTKKTTQPVMVCSRTTSWGKRREKIMQCSLFYFPEESRLEKKANHCDLNAPALLHPAGESWSRSFQPWSQWASAILCGAIYRVGDQWWVPRVNTSHRLFDSVAGELRGLLESMREVLNKLFCRHD